MSSNSGFVKKSKGDVGSGFYGVIGNFILRERFWDYVLILVLCNDSFIYLKDFYFFNFFTLLFFGKIGESNFK